MKTLLILSAVVAAVAGAASLVASVGGGSAAAPATAPPPAWYERVAAAPLAGAMLRDSAPVEAMARRSGIDPSQLRELTPVDQPFGGMLAGRDRSGRTCVAEATTAVAGSFECNPFANAPLYLVAGAHGTPTSTTWSGFVALVDTSVARVSVQLADGSRRDLLVNRAGGLEYGASSPASFDIEVSAYASDGRTLVKIPLQNPTPPSP